MIDAVFTNGVENLMNSDRSRITRRGVASDDGQSLKEKLYPFQKVTVSAPASVYYLGVDSFPVPDRWRGVIKELIQRLQDLFCAESGSRLLTYLGVIHSMLKPELLRALMTNNLEWRPNTALALLPDQPAPRIPSVEEVIEWEGNIPLDEVMPLITCITKPNAVKEASDQLFGKGALAFYISPLGEQAFLKKVKEVFGYVIEDPALNVINCLPFFRMNALLPANERQFRALFCALDLYIGESAEDSGYVIVSSKCLDDEIIELVSSFKSRGGSFWKETASL
jgi:hypothetical protein